MGIEAIRFRAAEAGVILQVLERTEAPRSAYYSDSVAIWRDAKVEDLLEVARFTTNAQRHTQFDQLPG